MPGDDNLSESMRTPRYCISAMHTKYDDGQARMHHIIPMIYKQQTLSLVGLVVIVPAGSALAPLSTSHVASSVISRRPTAITSPDTTKPSRRAFFATISAPALGIFAARPANAATRFGGPINFGYIKRKSRWQRLGGDNDSSDEDEESSNDSSGSTSSDDSGSRSSSDHDRK